MKRSLAVIHILIFILSILSGGCAHFYRTQITLTDAENIISGIKEQGDKVESFYSLGVVTIKGWIMESDADILIAGVRDPFALKMEITHAWGRPVLHILIKEGRLTAVSFQEKLTYSGIFTPEALSKFFPGFSLDREMIWSILGGRPPVVAHDIVSVSSPGIISLSSYKGIELEAIYAPVQGSLPPKVSFPSKSLNILFSEWKVESGISYAGEIKLKGKSLEKDLTLNTKKMVFNSSLPEKIFELEIPSGYETVNLDDLPLSETE